MSIFLTSLKKRDVIRYAPQILTAEYQPDDTDGLDTYINSVSPTTNYDFSNVLNMSGSQNILIKCPNFTWVPSGEILFFRLHLYTVTSTTTTTLSLYPLLRNWVETQATWNVYSTGNNWTTAGGLSDGNDKEATAVAVENLLSTEDNGVEHRIDLPLSLLSDWQTTNYGLIGLGGFFAFHASRSATPEYRPKWSVEYLPT
jgi:hypothetical protein